MLASVPGSVLDGWERYYVQEPWDIPRQYWPDIQRKIAPTKKAPTAPKKQTKQQQLSFFNSFIQKGKVIDMRGKTPTA